MIKYVKPIKPKKPKPSLVWDLVSLELYKTHLIKITILNVYGERKGKFGFFITILR